MLDSLLTEFFLVSFLFNLFKSCPASCIQIAILGIFDFQDDSGLFLLNFHKDITVTIPGLFVRGNTPGLFKA